MNYELPGPTRLLLYFARCPDEELTSTDIRQKFGMKNVANTLKWRRDLGLLRCRIVQNADMNREFVWSAGPALLRECGIEEAA